LKVVLKGVPKRLGADAIAVSLLDEDQLTSQVFVMRLPNGTIVDKEAFSIAESSRLQMHNEQINNVKLCSYLGVPMIMKGKTIGILHLLTTKPKIFAQEDISFFETLAGQAAIAIENARLYTEALERSRTVERMINESLIIARSAPSEIADLVCQSVRRVMGVEKVAFFCYNKMKKVLFKEKVSGRRYRFTRTNFLLCAVIVGEAVIWCVSFDGKRALCLRFCKKRIGEDTFILHCQRSGKCTSFGSDKSEQSSAGRGAIYRKYG